MVYTRKKDTFLHQVISFFLPAFDDENTFCHKHQVAVGKRRVPVFWRGERALLQSFVIKNVPAVFPVQELDVGSGPVEENEDLAAGGRAVHGTAYQSAQPVEALAHVAGACVQIKLMRGAQRKHISTNE